MPRIDGFLQLLDTRSFPSLWYWLLLAAAWSFSLRGALGVPADVAARAARIDPDAGDAPEALALLDWLSLMLPRWRLGRHEAAILTGLATFSLSALFGLGFGQGLELAQAVFLLLAPLVILTAMRLRLAARLAAELAAAEQGRASANAAAMAAARRLARHRWAALALATATVGLAAAWGTIWTLAHPWGPVP